MTSSRHKLLEDWIGNQMCPISDDLHLGIRFFYVVIIGLSDYMHFSTFHPNILINHDILFPSLDPLKIYCKRVFLCYKAQ